MTEAATDRKALTRTACDPASAREELQACAGRGDAIDRLLARNPNASAQLLTQLSRSNDRATRKAVTLHPNTPEETLLKLAPQFPGDFFKNPVFDWLLIEHPTLLLDIGGGVLKNLLKRADCPVSFMTWAVENGDEQQKLAVAMNAEAPEGLLRKLVADGEEASHSRSLSVPVARSMKLAGEAAKGHLKLTEQAAVADLDPTFLGCVNASLAAMWPTAAWRRGLIGPGQWLALSLGDRLAVVGTCSVEDLVEGAGAAYVEALAMHANDGVRLLIAKSADTPPGVLEALAADPDEWVRCAVAENPSTPERTRLDLMASLAEDEEATVRRTVARCAFTSASLLDQLARDSEEHVLVAVASNLATSPVTLEKLARSKKQDVREWVARHPSASPAVLAMLARDRPDEVRECVADNPSTPPSVLVELAKDRSLGVRKSAAGNANTPAHLLVQLFETDGPYHMRYWLADNPAAPGSIRVASLESLAAAEEDWFCRRRAAQSAACPPHLLDQLAKDTVTQVRLCVAGNPAASTALLERLARDRSKHVRTHAKLRLAGTAPPPADVRLARALRWHNRLRRAAKRLAWSTADPALAKQSAEELVAMHRQECADLLLNPAACIIARLLGADAANVLLIPAEQASAAARSSDRAVRLLGLCHVNADRADLVKYHRSTDWAERLAVARNPATPSGVLASLTKDAHRLVALQAEATRRLAMQEACP